jgi:hypothetical protein
MAFYQAIGIPPRTATRYMREAGRYIGQRLADTRGSKSTVAERHAAKAQNTVSRAQAEAVEPSEDDYEPPWRSTPEMQRNRAV